MLLAKPNTSLNELGPNRVPSPRVVTNTQIQVLMSISSPSVRSISAKVVTVVKVDMCVREENQPGQLMPEGIKREKDL